MVTKEQLLATNYFVDNEQLASYVALVNASTECTAKYTERHHIIPRSYYKITKQKIDSSKENIVKLSFLNHIKAHYYLSFCTIGRLRQANISAFILLVDTNLAILSLPEQEAIIQLEKYAELQYTAKMQKQTLCSAVGKVKTPAHRTALALARDKHSTTKNKKSVYNETLNSVKFVSSDELDSYLDSGWRLGGKPLSKEAKAKISKSNSTALRGKKHNCVKVTGNTRSGLIGSKVLCVETGTVFDSVACAKKWLADTIGIDGGQIKNCCAGARQTTGGYHWQYWPNKN